MEVLKENSAMLSNHEVYTLLNDIQTGQNGQKKPNKHQHHLATISYSTLKYLEKTPCKDQITEDISTFMQAVSAYNLTKAEKLQLLNNRPRTAVEIQLMIEESEERLTEQQIDELLHVITSTLPGEDIEAELEQEEEQVDEEMQEDNGVVEQEEVA